MYYDVKPYRRLTASGASLGNDMDKIQALCNLIEAQQRARLVADGMSRLLEGTHYTGKVKIGRKYANIDFGGSGKYMVELSTGNVYGIKAYGVIHRGHQYGTLDTIDAWDWSGYTAVSKQSKAA